MEVLLQQDRMDHPDAEHDAPDLPRRWPRSVVLVILAITVLTCLNLLTAIPRPASWDAAGYYAWGQALLQNGNLNPTPFLPEDAPMFPRVLIHGQSLLINKYPIGWSLAVLPFAAAGKLASACAGMALGSRWTLKNSDALLVRTSWIGIMVWVLIGITVCYRTLEKLGGWRAAALATTCAWLGTGAFAQTWKNPGMSHGLSMALISLVYYFAVDYAIKPRLTIAMLWGFFCGMTFCTRNPNFVLLLPSVYLMLLTQAGPTNVLLDGLKLAANWPRRLGHIAVCGAAGAVPVAAVQMLAWHSVYGQWFFNGYAVSGEHFLLNWNDLSRVLLTSYHGILWRHPIVILSITGAAAGIIFETRPATKVASAFVLAVILEQILQYGSWPSWIDQYGARWTSDSLVFWAMGLLMIQRAVRPASLQRVRIIAWSLAGISALMLLVQIFVLRIPGD